MIGALAVVFPAGFGYPPVAGYEVTKPFWPILWVYGLENLLGVWGMVVGPAVLLGFLALVPLLDRKTDSAPGQKGWVGWVGLAVAAAVLALWLYGVFGSPQQHNGM